MITCEECPDSTCCRDVTVEIDEPDSLEDWDEFRWMVAHKNVAVYKDDEDDWVVEFKTPCENLEEDGKCKVYYKRPRTCSKHSPETCVRNGEEDAEEIRFDTMEQVEEYVKEKVLPKLEKEAQKNWEELKNLKWGKAQE